MWSKIPRVSAPFLARAAVGAAWALLAAEAWLRILDPVPMLPRYVTGSDMGIRVNMPDRVYWHRTAEVTVRMRTNARGVRSDVEHEIPKPPGVFRIVALGDSFGMGYEAALEDSAFEVMRRELQRHTDLRVEVVNLSVSGHGNAEQLVMLTHRGIQYEPDLTVVLYTSTDPSDNARSRLFRLDPLGKLTPDQPSYLPGVKIQQTLASLPLYNFVADNSNLYNLLRDRAGIEVKAALLRIAELRRRLQDSRSPAPAETAPESEASLPERLTIALLHELRRVSAEIGAPTLLVSVPIRHSRISYTDPFPYDTPGADALETLSLVNDFTLAADPAVKLYWERGHGHWTARGQEVAGKAMAKAILDRGLMP